MTEDISKTTVGVLLILTIIISVIGTWTVLNSVDSRPPIQIQKQTESASNVGQVKVKIGPEPVITSDTAGQVKVKIG